MKILRLNIKGFRGIQEAQIDFDDHTVLWATMTARVSNLSELKLTAKVRGISALRKSLDRRFRLTGEPKIQVGEVKAEAGRILQRIRSQSTGSFRGIKAMTIYQAKNREFENVIILWPHEVGGTPESWRRLLYNGVTRAKSRVLVIVHSPPDKKGQVKDRLASSPFSKECALTLVQHVVWRRFATSKAMRFPHVEIVFGKVENE